MDVQDHTTHSGHEGHGVHLCHRCGWPFHSPHPSAKHRRAHKKICGTIEGYTNLIGSEVVSDDDDEHHPDDDQENTPSPKIDKKVSDVSDGEIRGRLSRSEDEFADAVTDFADSGSANKNKTLDKDLFFSFKDAEDAGTNEVLNDQTIISKVDTSTEDSEKTDPHVEKIEETVGDSSESNLELTRTGDLVKDGVVGHAPEPILVSQSQEAKSIDVMEEGEEKGQENKTCETITEEAKDSEITKTTPEVSALVGEYPNNVKLENSEKLESITTDGISEEIQQEIKDSEITKTAPEVSAITKTAPEVSAVVGISEEIKQEIKSDCEHVPEIVKESETVEEIKIEKSVLDHEIAPEVVKGSETDQNLSVLNEKVDLDAPNEQVQEVVKEPVAVLIEKKELEEPELEKSSIEQIQETVKEPVAVLIEKEDLGEPQLEKQLIEHTHEVVEKPDTILTEKNLDKPEFEGNSKEQIQVVVKEPDTVLTEKEDLVEPHLEKQPKEQTHEVVEKPDSILTEKDDLGAQKVDNDCNLVADVSTETITLKDSSEPVGEEGIGKLVNKQGSGADLTVDSSSPNSLEGTWGSVSVLSTTSIDAETLQLAEKSKVNSAKSNSATSDVFEPPSFMTLVEPESQDKKSDSSKVQDSQPQPNSEASQAGWFPTLTKVNNESEGRKKNEEVIAKVTNWTTGKQSTPLKNLLGEARSPSGKQPDPVVQKDEAAVNPSVNDDVSSPPKLIDEGKKGRKKVKGISSWVPFVCCSSVNAVK